MNKQALIIVGAIVVVILLFIALNSSNEGKKDEVIRGATSTVGEIEEEKESESALPVEVNQETQNDPINSESIVDNERDEPNINEEEVVEDDEVSEEETVPEQVEENQIEEVMVEATTTPAEEGAIEEEEEEVEKEEQAEDTEEELVIEEEEVVEEQVILSTLVGHYTFDEGTGSIASDISGYENHATLINTDETVWKTGLIGESLAFDGLNDHVKILHSDSLNVGAIDESYSISFWFFDDSKPSSEREILGKGARSGPSPFIFRLDKGGNVSFRISDGFEANIIETSDSIVRNEWVHVVGIRDTEADDIKIYIDRNKISEQVQDTTSLDIMNTLDVYINRYDEGTTYFHDRFSVDDLQIYNRVLTQEEISTIYNEGKGI